MTSLTSYLDIPLPQLAERALAGTLRLSLDDLDAILGEHSLDLEATGSRETMLDGAVALHDLAAWAAEQAEARYGHRWELLGEHLTDRATRSDSIGLEALLRSDNGKARRLLELLAATPGGSMPRAELGERLVASQSHLSHILRSLHDADLIHRQRTGKAVTVTLAARGREALGVGSPSRSAADLTVLIDGLPADRRHQVLDRPTRAPVFALPA